MVLTGVGEDGDSCDLIPSNVASLQPMRCRAPRQPAFIRFAGEADQHDGGPALSRCAGVGVSGCWPPAGRAPPRWPHTNLAALAGAGFPSRISPP
jgi:hypothetical protein